MINISFSYLVGKKIGKKENVIIVNNSFYP